MRQNQIETAQIGELAQRPQMQGANEKRTEAYMKYGEGASQFATKQMRSIR